MNTKHVVERPVEVVLHALKNPLSTVSYGVGLIRGAAGALVRAASGGGGPAHAEWIAPPEPVSEEALDQPLEESEESGVLLGDHLEPAEPQAPGEPGEQFATEPTAVTRASAHGGGGRDEQLDDWYGETDADDAGPGSVVEMLEAGDDLPDDGGPNEKAILSESEILRRAADPNRR